MATMHPKRKKQEKPHFNSLSCWCGPVEVYTAPNGNTVIVHKGNGDELPPSNIIAQAIADAIAGR